MLSEAMAVARTIAAKSPVAMRGIKEVMLYTRDHSLPESLAHLAVLNAAVMLSADFTETMAARKDQRDPVYGD